MQLTKTEKGREALLHRDPNLSTLDRRILIVSDGRRNIGDVASLLGEEVPASLDRLLREGYLTGSASTAVDGADLVAPAASTTVSQLLRRSIASMEKVQELAQSVRGGASAAAPSPAAPAPDTKPEPTPAAASSAPRRSLAASRMYMLDMLQRLRGDEAKWHAEAIRAAHGDSMVAHLAAALRHIHASTSTSYAQRVSERLGEVLPAEYLSQLDGLQLEATTPQELVTRMAS